MSENERDWISSAELTDQLRARFNNASVDEKLELLEFIVEQRTFNSMMLYHRLLRETGKLT